MASNLVRHLKNAGYKNLTVIDDLTDGSKFRNLAGCGNVGYIDKDEYLKNILSGFQDGAPDYVFHLGAISSTTHKNGKELMDQNYQYSVDLISACASLGIPIQYASSASVYGNKTSQNPDEEPSNEEEPLNCYAFSKQMVDFFVRELLWDLMEEGTDYSQIIGLRYTNVFGPNEEHKGNQASPVYQFFNQASENGEMKVFDVQARRDFVHVDDVCQIHLWLMENQQSGIVDVGTGVPRSFDDVAKIVSSTLEKEYDWDPVKISKVPFPHHLLGHYQFYTRATHCLNAGYPKTLLTLEEGVAQYVKELTRRYFKMNSYSY